MMPHRRLALISAAALGFALLAVPAAQAFTFESTTGDSASAEALAPGAKPYADPTDRLNTRTFDDNGKTVVQQGGVTMQFGHERSFNEKYNPSNLFDPLRR